MRVMDLADELGVSTVAIVQVCQSLGIDGKWAGAELSEADCDRIRAAGPPAPAEPTGRYSPTSEAPAGPAAGPPGFPPAATPAPSPFPGQPAPAPSPFPGQPAAAPGFPPASAAVPPVPPAPPVAPAAAFPGALPPAVPGAPAMAPVYQRGYVPARRREQMVVGGWEMRWRSCFVVIGTLIVTGILNLITSGLGTIRDAYQTNAKINSIAGPMFVLFVQLIGYGWATRLKVTAASNSLDGWNRISANPSMLKGQVSITYLVAHAVWFTTAFITLTVVSVIVIVRNLA